MTNAQTSHDTSLAQATGMVLISLNRLKKSPRNGRKTLHAKSEIEALAASIHAKA
jgi:ParB family transcriptional regulator, chromosome partitioning protein